MDAVLLRAESADPGSADVGATRAAVLDAGPLPEGHDHLRLERVVGYGRDAFDAAAEAVLTWQMHRGSGLRVAASAPRAEVGVTVVSYIGAGPVRLPAPCRVVWTVDEPDRKGFGYATLPGHPELGEEAFVVSMDAAKVVRLHVVAFSRPGRWFTKVAAPLVPRLQRLAVRGYARAVAGAVRSATTP